MVQEFNEDFFREYNVGRLTGTVERCVKMLRSFKMCQICRKQVESSRLMIHVKFRREEIIHFL